MALNIGATGSIKPYVKFNAKPTSGLPRATPATVSGGR